MRANLVNRDTLARLARGLALSGEMRLGEGEIRSGGAERPSILADALEAVFGAVFVDGGFDAARDVIERVYAPELVGLDPGDARQGPEDAAAGVAAGAPHPRARVRGHRASMGEAHAQTFTIECRIPALAVVASGSGTSRRAAEQAAAAQAYALAVAAHGD